MYIYNTKRNEGKLDDEGRLVHTMLAVQFNNTYKVHDYFRAHILEHGLIERDQDWKEHFVVDHLRIVKDPKPEINQRAEDFIRNHIQKYMNPDITWEFVEYEKPKPKEIDMSRWEEWKLSINYGDEAWYYFHNYKNQDNLLYMIIGSPFLILFGGNLIVGFILFIAAWVLYFVCSSNNNGKLQNNEYIQEKMMKKYEAWLLKKEKEEKQKGNE